MGSLETSSEPSDWSVAVNCEYVLRSRRVVVSTKGNILSALSGLDIKAACHSWDSNGVMMDLANARH